MASSPSFQSILITGASSGIGAALALHYAMPGVTLHLSGRDAVRLERTVQAARAKGAQVFSRILDVLDRTAMRDWIEGADRQNPLDLVIANAGISGGMDEWKGVRALEAERRVFDINVTGVLNTVEPALPPMVARGRGQVAVTASLASFSGWASAPAYAASKAAVRVYGEGLRGAVAGTGVGINIICPGFIESRMTAVNRFPMPFLMKADRAARIIARGLARNRGRIAFPWPMYLAVGCIGMLPYWLFSVLTRRLPAKTSHGSSDG